METNERFLARVYCLSALKFELLHISIVTTIENRSWKDFERHAEIEPSLSVYQNVSNMLQASVRNKRALSRRRYIGCVCEELNSFNENYFVSSSSGAVCYLRAAICLTYIEFSEKQ